MNHFPLLLGLALAPALASGAAADVLTVHSNGSKQYTTIQAAVDAAQAGDTVVVFGLLGPHPGFTIDGKPVNVSHRGAGIATTSPVVVRNLPAGSEVYLSGIKPLVSTDTVPFLLEDNAGRIWLQTCGANSQAVSATHSAVLRIENCADVLIVKGEYTGKYSTGATDGVAGLWATDSRVTLYNAQVIGGTGAAASAGSSGGRGGAAVRGSNTDILFGDCYLTGGTGGAAAPTDCGPGDGGPALQLEGTGSALAYVDTATTGGAAGAPGLCTPASAGPAYQDNTGGTFVTAWPGEIATLGVPSTSLIEGSLLSLQFPEPNASDLSFLALGYDMGTTTLPHLQGRLAMDPVVAVLYVEPTLFAHILPMVVPTLPPGVESMRFYIQAAQMDVGSGAIQLGGPHCLHVLDSSYF